MEYYFATSLFIILKPSVSEKLTSFRAMRRRISRLLGGKYNILVTFICDLGYRYVTDVEMDFPTSANAFHIFSDVAIDSSINFLASFALTIPNHLVFLPIHAQTIKYFYFPHQLESRQSLHSNYQSRLCNQFEHIIYPRPLLLYF